MFACNLITILIRAEKGVDNMAARMAELRSLMSEMVSEMMSRMSDDTSELGRRTQAIMTSSRTMDQKLDQLLQRTLTVSRHKQIYL
jgi:hypothetical protein